MRINYLLAVFCLMPLMAVRVFALEIMPPPDASHTLLHEAAKQCDARQGKSAISRYAAHVGDEDRDGQTPLMYAAESGCQKIALLLLKAGAAIDAQSRHSRRTALMYAAEQNHADMVRFLLAHGADPNKQTGKGDTALLFSLKGTLFPAGPKGDVHETFAALLDRGADVNARGEFGRSPIFYTVFRIDALLASQLLRKGADVSVRDDKGKSAIDEAEQLGLEYFAQLLKTPERSDIRIQGATTPLADAIKEKNISKVRALLNAGTEVNARFGNGSTALMTAAHWGQADMVKLLLDKGAEINAKNGGNATALMFAVLGGHVETVRTLLSAQADVEVVSRERTALFFAVQNKNPAMVKLLLDKGAKANIQVDGSPLLLTAVQTRHFEIVSLLLDHGAPIDAADTKGTTALMAACQQNDWKMVQLLLGKGADINRADRQGATALSYALAEGHDDLVRLLLSKGAQVRADEFNSALSMHNVELAAEFIAKGAEVKDALLTALPHADLKLVTLLIEKGADINARNANKKTPLHIEAETASGVHPEVLRYLLAHGAEVNAQDEKGMTPLLSAVHRGDFTLAQILLEKGGDAKLKNVEGKTAWQIAAQRADQSMMRLLEQYGAVPDYVGMKWEGHNAKEVSPYIRLVDNAEEWTKLWQRNFDTPVPALDFSRVFVACVFLGEAAPRMYSIVFSEPYKRDGNLLIPYRLMELVEMEIRMTTEFGRQGFGGIYHMKVFAKQEGRVPELVDESPEQGVRKPRHPSIEPALLLREERKKGM